MCSSFAQLVCLRWENCRPDTCTGFQLFVRFVIAEPKTALCESRLQCITSAYVNIKPAILWVILRLRISALMSLHRSVQLISVRMKYETRISNFKHCKNRSKVCLLKNLAVSTEFTVKNRGLIHYNKGKAIPLQPLRGPECSRRLSLPDFKTIRIWRWQVYQPYAPAAFTPRKYSWYSFLLEAESTPGS
jgi:hypothetical protein